MNNHSPLRALVSIFFALVSRLYQVLAEQRRYAENLNKRDSNSFLLFILLLKITYILAIKWQIELLPSISFNLVFEKNVW